MARTSVAAARGLGISFEWEMLVATEILAYIFPTWGRRVILAFRLVVFCLLPEFRPGQMLRFGYLAFSGYNSKERAVLHFLRTGLPLAVNAIVVLLCYRLDEVLRQATYLVLRWSLQAVTLIFLPGITSRFIAFVWHNNSYKSRLFGSKWTRTFLNRAGNVLSLFISWDSVLTEFHRAQRRSWRVQVGPPSRSVADDYKYQRLSPRNIRLVRLTRTSGQAECSLIERSLEHPGDYIAVSYTWISVNRTHGLLIDGKWLATTASAYEIVQEQADSWSDGPEILLWVDFLCINQEDGMEKTEQVRMMQDIYSRASSVVTYLSAANHDDADMAAYFLQELDSNIRLGRRRRYGLLGFGFNFTGQISPGWNALAKLINHPYWTRVWIVQEVARGATLRIFYGENELDWVTLLHFMGQFHLLKNRAYTDNDSIGYVQGAFPIYGGLRIEGIASARGSIRAGKELGFIEMLLNSRRLNATDPRDHVFAIQGLVQKLPDHLRPDYEKSAKAVYTEAATYVAVHHDVIWLLRMAGIGHVRKITAPSWVPDWSQTYPTMFPVINWRNTQKLPTAMYCMIDGDHFITNTTKTHRIRRTSMLPFTKFGEDLALGHRNVVEACIRGCYDMHCLVTECNETYPNGQSRSEALLQTLAVSNAVDATLLDDFTVFLRALDGAFPDCMTLFDLTAGARKILHAGKKFTPVISSWRPSLNDVHVYSGSRSLAVTDSGYFALVPLHTMAGDEIHHLLGCDVPFVIRRAAAVQGPGIDYHLVGDCHLHGMSGINDTQNPKRRNYIVLH